MEEAWGFEGIVCFAGVFCDWGGFDAGEIPVLTPAEARFGGLEALACWPPNPGIDGIEGMLGMLGIEGIEGIQLVKSLAHCW